MVSTKAFFFAVAAMALLTLKIYHKQTSYNVVLE